jgi:HSP20 family protein
MASRELQDWIAHLGYELKWLSGDFTGAPPTIAQQRGWTPRIDLLESEDFFLVRAELAGVRASEVSLRYYADRNALVIRGQRIEDDDEGALSAAPHLLEIDFGEFSREIALPESTMILAEGVKTHFRSGLLYILLPKRDQEESSVVVEKTITVIRR